MGFSTGQVDHLAADLAAAPVKVTAGCVVVVAHVANQVEHDAKRFVPVLTGALHDGIHTHAHGLSAEIIASSLDGGAGREYSGYVEYGTDDTRPQPFMRPAAELAYGRLADGAGDAGEHIL